MKIYVVVGLISLGLVAMACKDSKKPDATVATPEQLSTQETKEKTDETQWVFKYDGSLQCGMGEAIAIDEMQKELTGIPVLATRNLSDGQMRTQVCGSPTGKVNAFKINKTDVEKAKSLGFLEWSFEAIQE